MRAQRSAINRLQPEQPARASHLESCLNRDSPIVAATDYVRAYPELIAAHVRQAVPRAWYRRFWTQRYASGVAGVL